MDLKSFHIFFIVAATLLCLGFGMWSVNAWLDQRGGDWLAMGVGSFAVAIALLGYGAWFLKKLRNMSSQ
jgi:hypothetical protein